MDTLENLRGKIDGATDIKSVVKAMKAVAASNIGQYEQAVSSLGDYYRTVALGIVACLKAAIIDTKGLADRPKANKEKLVCAIVFGSDQGLVGQFNDSLADFVSQTLNALPGTKEIWVAGERVQLLLLDEGFTIAKSFLVPNAVNAVTALVGNILIQTEEAREKKHIRDIYVFHNQPKPGTGYTPVVQQLLPLDEKWKQSIEQFNWPTQKLPQVLGDAEAVLAAFIREFFFVSLFKACAESLASENASRLAAMQRAEKNIGEMLDGLNAEFYRLRQNSIDEELFEVIAGFEALKGGKKD